MDGEIPRPISAVTEGLPASGQTALHRPDRAAESVGRFLHRGALEQAQDKDVAVSGRQPPQLVVEDRHHVRPLGLPQLAGADRSVKASCRWRTACVLAFLATRVATP